MSLRLTKLELIELTQVGPHGQLNSATISAFSNLKTLNLASNDITGTVSKIIPSYNIRLAGNKISGELREADLHQA